MRGWLRGGAGGGLLLGVAGWAGGVGGASQDPPLGEVGGPLAIVSGAVGAGFGSFEFLRRVRDAYRPSAATSPRWVTFSTPRPRPSRAVYRQGEEGEEVPLCPRGRWEGGASP